MSEEYLDFLVEAGNDASIKGINRGSTQIMLQHIPIERLQQELKRASRGLSKALKDLREVGDFKLKTVTVAVEVSAEGGVSFIGSAKAAGKGAITLTFEADE